MKRLFKQFSFPGGIPSHVAPETPGSIHEGGELGYSLSHAYGAAFDNPGPDRRVRGRRRRGGDRPAGHELALEQVPQPGPRRRGAADPAPERLQDRRPHGAGAHSARRAGRAASAATDTRRTSSRATTRRRCTSSWPTRSTRWSPRSSASSATARTHGFQAASALADDRAALAQGLDGSEGRGWQADRGHVPFAPGADGRHEPPGPREDSREVDEELPTAGAVRLPRPAPCRPSAPGANGTCPRSVDHPRPSDPSQPFGERSTMSSASSDAAGTPGSGPRAGCAGSPPCRACPP